MYASSIRTFENRSHILTNLLNKIGTLPTFVNLPIDLSS